MRRRLRGQYQGQEIPGGHRLRARNSSQSRPSRGGGRRPAGRRRRRLSDPNPRSSAARLGRARGPRTSRAGRLRRGDVFPAARRGYAQRGDRPVRTLHPGRGPDPGRLARGADRHHGSRPRRRGADAGDPPGHRRAGAGRGGPGRLRAQAAGHPQADAEPARRTGGEVRHAAPVGLLHAVVFHAHRGLQGAAARGPGRDLLSRPIESADGVGAGVGSPALFHQHLPVVEAGAPLSLHRPQRRDQHGARQRQLDECAASHAGVRPYRPGPRQDVAADPPWPVRHGLAGQCPGAAHRRRLSA